MTPERPEVQSIAELTAAPRRRGEPLAGLRLQGLDLRPVEAELSRRPTSAGLVVLGGQLSPDLERAPARARRPRLPRRPAGAGRPLPGPPLHRRRAVRRPRRATATPATPDARAYRLVPRPRATSRDIYATLLRAIHDDAMTRRPRRACSTRSPSSGVMGGHADPPGQRGVCRGRPASGTGSPRRARRRDRRRPRRDGGGQPRRGRASTAWPLEAALDRAGRSAPAGTATSSAGPAAPWRPRRWHLACPRDDRGAARPARAASASPPGSTATSRRTSSPTPSPSTSPTPCARTACSPGATAGIVVLPGAAGTVQEVFQAATRLYYARPRRRRAPARPRRTRRHWTEETSRSGRPSAALGGDRRMAGAIAPRRHRERGRRDPRVDGADAARPARRPRRGGSRRRGGQLPAGAVDVRPAGVAHRRRDAAGPQPLDELLLDARPRRRPLRAGRRVERDGVDVHPAAAPGDELLARAARPARPGR